MHFKETKLPGVWVIDPVFHADNRGRFFRAWCSRELADHGIDFVPIQANIGLSVMKGTIRGMHYQTEPDVEAKLVRCTKGAIFDVALDLRPGSPTFRQWFDVELTAENGRMLYLPAMCAHGYQTLKARTEMFYMTSQVYSPQSVRGARFDDPAFSIQWPLIPSVISPQDRNWPLTKESTEN